MGKMWMLRLDQLGTIALAAVVAIICQIKGRKSLRIFHLFNKIQWIHRCFEAKTHIDFIHV